MYSLTGMFMLMERTHGIKILRSIIPICLVFTGYLFPGTEDRGRFAERRTDVLVEAFQMKSDQAGKGHVDIFIQTPYSGIKFVKEEDRYVGRLEISAAILKEEQQVWQKSQSVELSSKDFSKTGSSNNSSLKQFSTDLPPGKYELLVQVKDQESKTTVDVRKPLVVRNMEEDSLSVSDIMLVSRVAPKGVRKDIVLNLTGVIYNDTNGLYLFFEIYNKVPIDSVQLLCKFIDSFGENVMQRSMSDSVASNRTQIIWHIDSLAFPTNKYEIKIEAVGYLNGQENRRIHASVSRNCLIQIKGLPATVISIDKAIDQLVYIAKGEDISYIRSGETPTEKQKRFLEFWAKRDPDPGTPDNELMEEYYSRVEYANKNFSGFGEGWRSDMGMVYIRFGAPENVERHPFNAENKPYEIWYYYIQNRQFIFVDDTGFGDYRLRYPAIDLWGRMR